MNRLGTSTVIVAFLCGSWSAVRADTAVASRAMVATVHPLATQAGLNAIRAEGNAIDAAVAAALTLGVVDSHNSGLGGGCLILLRSADGRLVAIDGRETAPAAAQRDMFWRDGQPRPELSQTGPLAVATPGALAAYAVAVRQYGKRTLADLLLPAADIAAQGFEVSHDMAAELDAVFPSLVRFPATERLLLPHGPHPPKVGNKIMFPDLATSYRAIAHEGTDWFYRGPFARQVETWMKAHGGILTAADFANYQAKHREPIVSTYRGYQIVGFPPPSSGGIHIAQMLNILEHFDLREFQARDPALVTHVMAESMKLAFADRTYWLGDADFVPVPRGLIDKGYARQLADRISLDRVVHVPSHSLPPDARTDLFRPQHTTHIATADDKGNWVALTATINTSFGSKVVVPGTGIVLNNEMDDFAIHAGVPNAFGLLGSENNAIAPGKRPLSSMSPTIVLRDGRPILTIGGAGGPKIITQTLSVLVRYLDLQMSLPAAVEAPRFHQQWSPDSLAVEASYPMKELARLVERGHSVTKLDSAAIVQAIGCGNPDETTFIGVADPRVAGAAGPM